jgi:hypothetical protein
MLGASPTVGVGGYGLRFNAHELVATRIPGIAPHLVSRLCTLQREFCSRCNVKLLHPLEFNGISRAKPLAS